MEPHEFNFFYGNIQPVEENIYRVNVPYIMEDQSGSSSNSQYMNCTFYNNPPNLPMQNAPNVPMQNAPNIAQFPYQYNCPPSNFNGRVKIW